ncbi:GNAT family N-acetyltransferase [Thaumasiovibrio sp. DFM-14]|uniref:GNAT family N-acetyltransferase n=1 Tax=Thaumasiovibrio sp. DFM-14 TaxID=3384792 RepID=UPI0039A21CE6
MLKLSFQSLDPIQTPLANKLYKEHYPSGKANKSDNLWIAKHHQQWIGVIKYRSYDSYLFMSGMLVIPTWRHNGIAERLLSASIDNVTVPVYCFAYAHLKALYNKAGFDETCSSHLPNELRQRFERYTSSGKKVLIPMRYHARDHE